MHLPDSAAPVVINERVALLLERAHGRILHVGCVGNRVYTTAVELGHCLQYHLTRTYPDTVGIDLNKHALRQLPYGRRYVAGDAHAMPFFQCFDTIVAGELIEHLGNPLAFLECCRAALRPGGSIILSTPNAFGPMYWLAYSKNFDHAFNPEHCLWFCPQTLCEILRRAGFQVSELLFADDLRPEVSRRSRLYPMFSWLWRKVRWAIPRRFRNTLIVTAHVAPGGKRNAVFTGRENHQFEEVGAGVGA